MVEWLFHHIEGFQDRREARKYASNLLKAGFIRHTVNKITFSEQCYYIFGDVCGSKLKLVKGLPFCLFFPVMLSWDPSSVADFKCNFVFGFFFGGVSVVVVVLYVGCISSRLQLPAMNNLDNFQTFFK